MLTAVYELHRIFFRPKVWTWVKSPGHKQNYDENDDSDDGGHDTIGTYKRHEWHERA